MSDREQRPGEVRLPFDPAAARPDAGIVFIGRLRSPWSVRGDCPRSLREARERGGGGSVEVDRPWRPGLRGLAGHSHVILLYWMHEARRDLIIQSPAHASEPRGVFSLRTPVRPNPIALAAVRLLELDEAAGQLTIDAIDCLDGTPLVDIKPYIPGIDAYPDAVRP